MQAKGCDQFVSAFNIVQRSSQLQKVPDFDILCLNFCQAYFSEVWLMQISVDHEILFIVWYVGIYVDFHLCWFL